MDEATCDFDQDKPCWKPSQPIIPHTVNRLDVQSASWWATIRINGRCRSPTLRAYSRPALHFELKYTNIKFSMVFHLINRMNLAPDKWAPHSIKYSGASSVFDPM
jgi:hypothetical protein